MDMQRFPLELLITADEVLINSLINLERRYTG